MLFLTLWLACDFGSSQADTASQDTPPVYDDQPGGQEGEELEDTTKTASSDPLSADKPSILFGEELIGCIGEDTLLITNSSAQARSIDEVTMSSGQGEITLVDIADSYLMQPGSTLSLRFHYTPLDDQPDETTIRFWGASPSTPELKVVASGKGLIYSEGVDAFAGNGSDTAFLLTEPAVPDTLMVSLDGAPLSADLWSYASQEGQVTLLTPPEPMATVDIAYMVPPPTCN